MVRRLVHQGPTKLAIAPIALLLTFPALKRFHPISKGRPSPPWKAKWLASYGERRLFMPSQENSRSSGARTSIRLMLGVALSCYTHGVTEGSYMGSPL